MSNFFAHISPENRARLDELFSDITDRSGEVAPISADERAARRERLGAVSYTHLTLPTICSV